MPGRKKCQPGCDCKKHSRKLDLSPEEREQRHRDQSREAMQRWRERNPEGGAEVMRRRRERAPEEVRAYQNEYYAANRERIRAQARARYAANPNTPEQNAEQHRRHGFSLTPERYEEMFAAQDGCCYLCNEPLDQDRYKITIDHDHSCCRGRKSCGTCVRGLACRPCNTGIAHFGDDPDRMRRVADNLEMATRRLHETRSIRANQASSNALAGEE